jgi:hypothetical protein
MASFIVLAAMKGRFLSDRGNVYDNFQMLGYVEASNPTDAVATFFDQPPYPIRWEDVEYLWAERLSDDSSSAHYGDYQRVYIDTLRRRYEAV